MECRFFWKEAWLKRVSGPHPSEQAIAPPSDAADSSPLAVLALRNTQISNGQPGSAIRYSCQATAMPHATTALSVWEPRQYLEDFRSGNATISQIGMVLFFLIYDTVVNAGLGLGSPLKWLYDSVQRLRGRWTYPALPGKLPLGSKTPTQALNLQRGDVVRVKPHHALLETLTEDWKNRGLGFHPEMVPYCERTFRVERRLTRILDEKTGHLVELKNPCITLEGVHCVGHYAKPLLCPRGMAPYWREIWLERTSDDAVSRV
jgi:hypothetical protein